MSKRIVKQPVMVQRDGELVYPTVGQEFDFTATEIEQINKLQPKALGLPVVVDEAPAVAAIPARKSVAEGKVAT